MAVDSYSFGPTDKLLMPPLETVLKIVWSHLTKWLSCLLWRDLENSRACLLMTQYLTVIGNIKLLWKPWPILLMTMRGYEDVTSLGLAFSLAPKPISVGYRHNLGGEPSVNLHQTLYESISNMFSSKTSQAFVLGPEFKSRAVHLLPA